MSQNTTRYRAVLVLSGDPERRMVTLRRAIKGLLRTYGIRLEAIQPEVPKR